VPFQVTYGYSKDKRPDLKEHEATFPDQKANVSRTRPPAGCSTTSWGCMCSTFRDKGSSCSI
jgi:hypothetical protein